MHHQRASRAAHPACKSLHDARVQVAGGPEIDMQYGRVDGTEDQVGDTTGLPAGKGPFPDDEGPGAHLRTVFYRMGFNDQEIVALSGAHTLGRAYKDRSGVCGVLSPPGSAAAVFCIGRPPITPLSCVFERAPDAGFH